MGFVTKIDYSDNRQVKQYTRSETALSGTTVFGVPFSALTSGVDMATVNLDGIGFYSNIVSTFSGNMTTTIITFGEPSMVVASTSLVAITGLNSGTTQTALGFEGKDTTIIDGNTVNLTYTGSTYDFSVTTMEEVGYLTWTGTAISNEVTLLSGGTLDYTERTIWVDVQGITKTEKLILSDTITIDNSLTEVLGRNSDGEIVNLEVSEISGTPNTDDFVSGATFSASTGDLNLEMQSGSTIQVNLDGRYLTTALANTDDYISGATFSASTGDLNLDMKSGSTVTVNLDGRYLTTATTNTDDFVSGATFYPASGNLDLEMQSGSTITVNLDDRYLTGYTNTDDYVSGATFYPASGNLTLEMQSGGTVTVNLDDRYSLTGHTHSFSADDISFTPYITITGTTVQIAIEDVKDELDLLILSGGGATQLNQLTDVTVSATTSKDILISNGSVYINRQLLESDISNFGVYLTGQTDDYVSGGTFYPASGDLDLEMQSGSTVTVNLDGRYLTSATANTDDYLITGDFDDTSGDLNLNLKSGGTVTINLDDRYSLTGHTHPSNNTDDYVVSAGFGENTGVLTLVRTYGGNVTVNLDDRYALITSLGNYLPLAGGTMDNANLVTNLNADFLDGYHATHFLRSSTSDQFTSGILTFNDSTKIGFGTLNAEGTLYSNGTNTYWDMGADKDLIIRDLTTTRFTLDTGGGNFTATGTITAANSVITGSVTAGSFIKQGGTSAQFLKADGTIDSNNYLPLTGGNMTGNITMESVELKFQNGWPQPPLINQPSIKHSSESLYITVGGTYETIFDSSFTTSDVKLRAPGFEVVGSAVDEYLKADGTVGVPSGGAGGTVTSIGITAGALIDTSGTNPVTSSGNITVAVDLSELSTSTQNADGDYFVVVDTANAQRKLTKANINVSEFNNNTAYVPVIGGAFTGDIAVGSIDLDGSEGIYFENKKHAITWNDGTGNFNIRVGNIDSGDEISTENGWAFHTEYGQSAGTLLFNISDETLIAGDPIASIDWMTQLGLTPTTVSIAYAGSTKLVTSIGGVTVTGRVTATTFTSTQTTGTRPFTVASSTMVNNLNTEFLGGLNSSRFLRSDEADAKTSGDLTINDYISLSFGNFGAESEIYSNSTNTYWELKSGNLNITDNGATKFTFERAGNLLFANNINANFNGKLKIHGGAIDTYADIVSGDLFIRNNLTTKFTFERISGNFTATGSIYALAGFETSDENLKEKTKLLTTSNDTGFKFYSFNWKDTKQKGYGVLAQEVEKITPELVSPDKDGTLHVNYTGVLVKEVASLKARIEKLEKLIHDKL